MEIEQIVKKTGRCNGEGWGKEKAYNELKWATEMIKENRKMIEQLKASIIEHQHRIETSKEVLRRLGGGAKFD